MFPVYSWTASAILRHNRANYLPALYLAIINNSAWSKNTRLAQPVAVRLLSVVITAPQLQINIRPSSTANNTRHTTSKVCNLVIRFLSSIATSVSFPASWLIRYIFFSDPFINHLHYNYNRPYQQRIAYNIAQGIP